MTEKSVCSKDLNQYGNSTCFEALSLFLDLCLSLSLLIGAWHEKWSFPLKLH